MAAKAGHVNFLFLVFVLFYISLLGSDAFLGQTSDKAKADFEENRQQNADIKRVHIIYMNHLDVGFNHFLVDVMNLYFGKFFPQAIQRAAELHDGGYVETFKYTTHPWLVSMYLDCPKNINIPPGGKLKCPSDDEVKTFIQAVKLGIITWHSGPMNMQYEFLDESLLEHAFNLSVTLDKRFNITRKYRTVSQRDVPGTTQSVIPVMVRQGISALTVGVNAASSPPAVPKIFNWQYKGDKILAMWHPNGYPNNPGRDPNHPGGLSVDDCLTMDHFDEALCFAFRSDNQGPPQSLQEILGYYEILRKGFPNAKLAASTLEEFTAAVIPVRDMLPTVEYEIGDTWIQGIQSDPRKVAEMRAFLRNRAECIKNRMCSYDDPAFFNSSRLLLKTGEHTWGRNGVWDTLHWSNIAFQFVKNTESFHNSSQSWVGQRQFTYLALEALGTHPLAKKVKEEFNELKAKYVDLKDYHPDMQLHYKCGNGIRIGFDPTSGFLNDVYDPENKISWVSKGNGLAKFQYQTYNQTDFDAMDAAYTYATWFSLGVEKPNITKNAHPSSRTWEPKLIDFYRKNDGSCAFYAHLEMKELATITKYGAPAEIWIHYASASDQKGIDITIQWFEKPATRMPESIFFSFEPVQKPGYTWSMSKSGQVVDPMNVVLNGSQRHHAIDKGVAFTDQNGNGIEIASKDVALVSTITRQYQPTAFPLPLHRTDEVTGMSYNLYNNVWNLNYVLWYPYARGNGDESFKARFSINFLKNHNANKSNDLKFKSFKRFKNEFEKL